MMDAQEQLEHVRDSFLQLDECAKSHAACWDEITELMRESAFCAHNREVIRVALTDPLQSLLRQYGVLIATGKRLVRELERQGN